MQTLSCLINQFTWGMARGKTIDLIFALFLNFKVLFENIGS